MGDIMIGIDLNKNMTFLDASMRYFEKDEYHITRTVSMDVLVMVYDGVLRFSEDGKSYEVYPGQYHIQRANTYQTADSPSDMPKYLYVHFLANWSENPGVLAKTGEFDINHFFPKLEALDKVAKGNFTKLEATALFYEILADLYRHKKEYTLSAFVADYILEHYKSGISLDEISAKFNFSKNHIINEFKKEFGITPFEYVSKLRIKEAERLLSVTSYSLENIAYECGFSDYSHFYKIFFREKGVSPGKWRSRRIV